MKIEEHDASPRKNLNRATNGAMKRSWLDALALGHICFRIEPWARLWSLDGGRRKMLPLKVEVGMSLARERKMRKSDDAAESLEKAYIYL
jgi:hypothetical protein